MNENKIIAFLNIDQQIDKLMNDKKLIIDNDSKTIFKDYLKSYGYNIVVKSLKHNLMYSDSGKTYHPEFTSNNLRYLLDIDRNISIFFWKYFKSIEMFLNSAIVKILYKFIDKKHHQPYICLLTKLEIDEIFELPENSNEPSIYKSNKGPYYEFFNSMTYYANNSDWLRKKAKNNESTIDPRIKSLISNFFVFKEFSKKEKNDKWQYLEIFNLSSAWTFSFCVKCFKALKISYQKEIILNFFEHYKPIDKHAKLTPNDFISLLQIFSDFRNKLAHNEVILHFKGNYNDVDLNKILNYFHLEYTDSKNIYLNQMLLIFEKIIDKTNLKKEIELDIHTKLLKRTIRADKISKLLFDIIEDFSKIILDESVKDLPQYIK